MANVNFKISFKKVYDYVSYQTDIFYKHKSKTNKQTPYSLIEEIILTNMSDDNLQDLVIEFETNTDILHISPVHISELYAHSQTKITEQIQINFNFTSLYKIEEAIPLNIVANLKNEKTNELIDSSIYSIILNPINQAMSDASSDHLLLSSFVTPNDNEVIKVINLANEILASERPEQKAFIGYQANDADSVRQEMKAIYDALSSLNIAYSNPPSSFDTFQRIRTPREVLLTKRGTCIDLSILYCACLENIGLNPILILIKNHAFVGCFLEDRNFESYSIDNVEEINNKSSRGNLQIELVETTGIPATSNLSFVSATQAARNNIELYNDYLYAIDINKCHLSYYRPIPTFKEDEQIDINIDEVIKKDDELTLESIYNRGEYHTKGLINDKFEYWARKLLDLNLRNRLINFKLQSSNLQVIVNDMDLLMHNLKNDEKISLSLSDDILDNNFHISSSFVDENMLIKERKGVYYCSGNEKLYKSLIKKTNSAFEETGSNILYLSIGLIEFTPENSKTSFLAPLFLVPARGKMRPNAGLYGLELIIDEMSINTTVLEYMKQICGVDLDNLYSVSKDEIFKKRVEIINTIRNSSCASCRITVEEKKCFLATFSFAHYIMWDDIKKRKDALLKNKIIYSLVNGTTILNTDSDVDLEAQPNEIACPLGADSSQIKAILDAEKGNSFVLDGPPGTGKSQTIVNMIVNAVYHGKSVLFVAEKMAALEVVKKRIDSLGLGFLALELHSNKSSKKSMLDHLDSSLNNEQILAPYNFDDATNDLISRRNKLNELITESKKNTFGPSLYESIISYLEVQKYYKDYYEDYDLALNLKDETKTKIFEQLSYLNALVHQRDEINKNPFHIFDYVDLNNINLDEFKDTVVKYKNELLNFKSSLNALDFDFKDIVLTKNNIEIFIEILDKIVNKKLSFFNFDYENFANIIQDLEVYLNYGVEIKQIRDFYTPYFRDSLYEIDSYNLLDEYSKIANSYFKRNKFIKNLRKLFKTYKVTKIKFKNDLNPLKILNQIEKVRKNIGAIKSSKTPIKYIFNNDDWNYLTCDYVATKEALNNTLELYKLVDKLVEKDKQIRVTNNLKKLYDNRETIYNSFIYVVKISYDKLKETEEILTSKYSYNINNFEYLDHNDFLNLLANKLDEMTHNFNYLAPLIIPYNNIINSLRNLSFPECLIKEYNHGLIKAEDLGSAFKSIYFHRLILEYTKDPFFKEFNSIIFNDIISNYKNALDEYSQIIVKETAARATKNYPLKNIKYLESTQIAQLNKYIKNGGKKTTIRNLLQDYEDLIRTICPVFLMSPLSAAQYLSVNSKKFDIVIFDEASQIPTAEAVGAISRGNSLIVAGDPEQMPPSNYFQTNLDALDDTTGIEDDLESLLDDCLAICMKRNRLLWHYRSQHESLIAFSNNEFYNHELYTFPSPDNNYSRIEFNYLKNGIYDHGVNKIEAQSILDYIEKHFKNEKTRNKTLGIVTFNLKQCDLIEGMVSDLFDKHPEYEKINNENEEPLFVKNLENVQGDERDIIVFSIGFGYDKRKKFSMHFGPLSLERGERRLNVAITRARQKMVIFSSIKGNDINTNKAKNSGSTVLKDFLNYAEKGNESLMIENSHQTKPKVGIEKYLQEDLKKLSIDSDLNVGDSKFRVNLCIKNKKNDYILGIIIDGDTYLNTPTCRDRNYVQSGVLNKLNWKIIRIYTYDYLTNKSLVINDILKEINNIDDKKETIKKPKTFDQSFEKKIINPYPHRKDYTIKNPTSTYPYSEVESNYYYAYQYLLSVVDEEGPISKTLLLQRFREFYDLKRCGEKAKRYFNTCIDQILKERNSSKELYDIFIYPINENINSISFFRSSDNSIRTIDQISVSEIIVALKDELQIQGKISIEDALKAISMSFGYKNLTSTTNEKLENILRFILSNYDYFETNEELISLKEN